VCHQKPPTLKKLKKKILNFVSCALFLNQAKFNFTAFKSLGFRVYQTLNPNLSTIHTFSIHGINLFELPTYLQNRVEQNAQNGMWLVFDPQGTQLL
jgi:hypothetical protein